MEPAVAEDGDILNVAEEALPMTEGSSLLPVSKRAVEQKQRKSTTVFPVRMAILPRRLSLDHLIALIGTSKLCIFKTLDPLSTKFGQE